MGKLRAHAWKYEAISIAQSAMLDDDTDEIKLFEYAKQIRARAYTYTVLGAFKLPVD